MSGPPRSRLDRLLLSPSPELGSDVERRQARLLAAVNLTAIVLYVFGAVTAHVFQPPPADVRLPITLGVYGSIAIVTYALSRSRRLRLATGLTLFFHWLTPVTNQLLHIKSDIPEPFWACSWLVLPILLASGLGRPSTAVIVSVASCLLPLLMMAATGQAPKNIAFPTTVFLTVFSGLALVMSRHRDAVERDRSAELRARNAELLALKESLEQRVGERTAELQKSRDDLDGAYQALRRNQDCLVLSEKMASLGRLTGGIAHEISSPLAAVRAALAEGQTLVKEYRQSVRDPSVGAEDHEAIAAEMASALDLASKGAERAASFVRSIKSQTRDGADREAVRFDLSVAVQDALQMVGHAAVRSGSRLHFHPSSAPIEIVGHPGRIGQVVTNLVTNAIDANASRGGGNVDIEVAREGDSVTLTVVDDGPGVPEEDKKRIFDPLFSTKPVGSGTGLGLTIVHDIVHGDFRGTVEALRAPGRGAMFKVRLPSSEPSTRTP